MKISIIENKTIDIIFSIIALVWKLCNLKNRIIQSSLASSFIN